MVNNRVGLNHWPKVKQPPWWENLIILIKCVNVVAYFLRTFLHCYSCQHKWVTCKFITTINKPSWLESPDRDEAWTPKPSKHMITFNCMYDWQPKAVWMVNSGFLKWKWKYHFSPLHPCVFVLCWLIWISLLSQPWCTTWSSNSYNNFGRNGSAMSEMYITPSVIRQLTYNDFYLTNW